MTSDFELLDAWGRGDKTAGSQLFSRHFNQLFGFFRNKVRDGAKDLVQQTFLACVESRSRFERRSSFRAYMFGVARNVLRKHLQRCARERPDCDVDVDGVDAQQPTPTEVLALRGERRLLLEALRRIPIDYQIALELYHWEGLTGPELSVVLGLEEPGVRSRIRRATTALRNKLAELAESPNSLESTMAGLTDWAHEIQAHFQAQSSSEA